MERNTIKINYKRAFDCSNCPGTSGEEGCPLWWSYAETDVLTGAERLTETCGLTAAPKFFEHVIRASNRPAAAIESTRNEILNGLGAVANVMNIFGDRLLSSPKGE